MKLGIVIGSVVCGSLVEQLRGERILLIRQLAEDGSARGAPFAACDTSRAGPGDTVLYEEGREAAMALRLSFNPADAAVMAVVDEVNRPGPRRVSSRSEETGSPPAQEPS